VRHFRSKRNQTAPSSILLNAFLQDLRYALRSLRRSPGFTAVAVLTLALGIGANSAIFSVVDAVLLRTLPYRSPERLVRITADLAGRGLTDAGIAVPELTDLREASGVVEDAAGIYPITANLTGGERPRRVETLLVSENYFTLLGARPRLGRLFDSRDAHPGIAQVAVISDALWRSGFGADPNIIGRTLDIDIDPYTVVGVLPPDFRHPGRTLQGDVEVWVPTGFSAAPFNPPTRRDHFMTGALGRLRPGVTPETAQARLDGLAAALRREHPDAYPASDEWKLRAIPLRDDLVGAVRPGVLVLMGAVGLVLLLACMNVANLLLARASARRLEIAVRRSLGAGRGRLVRQMLTESTLLGVLSGGVGILVAVWGTGMLIRLLPASTPRVHDVGLDSRVLLFTLVVSVVCGFLFGIVPALRSLGTPVQEDLRDGARGSGAGAQARLRAALVVGQVALALVLLVGAGLLVRSLMELLRVDPGFDPRNVLVARLWLPQPNQPETGPYFEHDRRRLFIRELLGRLETLPGVERWAITSDAPLSGTPWTPTLTRERSGPAGEALRAQASGVSPDYFAVLGVPLLRGRLLTEADDEKAPWSILVNETMARRYWPGGDAIGQRIKFGPPDSDAPWMTIVGIVGDVKAAGLGAETPSQVYLSLFKNPSLSLTVVLRSASAPVRLASVVEREIRAIDPDIPVYDVRTLEEALGEDVSPRRVSTLLLTVFSGVALLLAVLGVYGVAAYAARQRTREIGIRMALGATGGDVLQLMLRQTVVLTAIGLIIGVVASLSITRVLESLLFRVGTRDVETFAAVAIVLAGAALAASWIPARRAARTEPLAVLRHE
jgi:predicted permease